MTSADEFTRASPTYISAQRTNQAKHSGAWDFSPAVDRTLPWAKYAHAVLNPGSLVGLGLLGFCVYLLVRFPA